MHLKTDNVNVSCLSYFLLLPLLQDRFVMAS